MTNKENAHRQRVWQRKRKLKILLAFWWIMERVRSAKGQRLIKSFFRRIARNPKSSPDLAFRATEWLANIERGILERPLTQKDIRPIPATAPPLNVDLIPSEGDDELEQLLRQAKVVENARLSEPKMEGTSDRGSVNTTDSKP